MATMTPHNATRPNKPVMMGTMVDAATISTKTNADFMKVISPSMKYLSSMEAKLILGVLDECINQMEIASVLPTLLSCPEALSPSLGEEVVKALKEHQRLEEEYQAMVPDGSYDQSELKEQPTKSAKAVQDSFRNIMCLLRATPITEEVLKVPEAKTGGEMRTQRLKDGLCELREVVLERLLTTAVEERAHKDMMLELSLRYSANQKLIDSLDRDVAIAKKDKDTEISTLNDTVHQLKSTLHQDKKRLDEFVIRTRQDSEKQSQSDKKTSEGKQTRMQQEANQLRAQLGHVITENRETELELRKKKYKEETEIENLIQKYDAEIGEKQTELEEMTLMYENNTTELKDLEKQIDFLDVEYSQIMEEQRVAEELREQQERERVIQSHAATVIQAHWRGFCVRKAKKPSTKPKKGKKGKGKKGK